MVRYTRQANTIDVDVLTFSLNTVLFIPVNPLLPIVPSACVVESPQSPLTETPDPFTTDIWVKKGVRRVGSNKRQVIVTTIT